MKLRTILLAALASLVTWVLVSQAQVPGVNSALNTVFTLAYDNSTMKPTYAASQGFSPGAFGATDFACLYGSATKTIKVRRIFFGAVGSALATDPVSVVLRSTASSGGTLAGVNVTSVASYDMTGPNPAGTAVIDPYTTSPSVLGTFAGTLVDKFVTINGATTAVGPSPDMIFDWGVLGQPIVLRGTAQNVCLNGTNATGNLSTVTGVTTFEWTEE